MELRQLEYFRLAAHAGSFSAAAKASYVTQQTLSAAIASLEAELGAPLFLRTKQGIELTRFGMIALAHSIDIMQDVQNFKERVARFHQSEDSSVGFAYATATLPMEGEGFTIRDVKRFQALHPSIDVRLFELSSDACLAALDHGAADLAFIAGKPNPSHYEFVKLADARLLVAVASGSPLAQKECVRFVDLAEFDIFPVPDLNLSYRKIVEGYERSQITPRFAAMPFSLERAHEFVRSGSGIDFSPACYADDHPEGISYVPLAPEDSFTVPLGLANRLGRPLKLATQDLRRFIRDRYELSGGGPSPSAKED